VRTKGGNRGRRQLMFSWSTRPRFGGWRSIWQRKTSSASGLLPWVGCVINKGRLKLSLLVGRHYSWLLPLVCTWILESIYMLDVSVVSSFRAFRAPSWAP